MLGVHVQAILVAEKFRNPSLVPRIKTVLTPSPLKNFIVSTLSLWLEAESLQRGIDVLTPSFF